jgi:hypothetical protein
MPASPLITLHGRPLDAFDRIMGRGILVAGWKEELKREDRGAHSPSSIIDYVFYQ